MQSIMEIDWRDRWLGGFCALGAIGGLPIRGPDYVANPPLDEILTLPTAAPLEPASIDEVNVTWSELLHGAPFVLVRSVDHAYRLVLQATGLRPHTVVGLPANATRPLVEALKRFDVRPFFVPLDDHLQLRLGSVLASGVEMVCGQSIGGMNDLGRTTPPALFLDFSDSLPGELTAPYPLSGSAVCIWGMHLAADPDRNGAIISIHGAPGIARQNCLATLEVVQSLLGADDQVDQSRALAQGRRLAGSERHPGLAPRQNQSLAAVWHGLTEAAGLELAPLARFGALAHGVAVRAPSECDSSTFYAYVKGENTPIRWLAESRPIHYAAIHQRPAIDDRLSAEQLARWLIVPVGPDYTDQEMSHSVLGIVKASEYLGVRWRTDPVRAVEYATLMDEIYGPDHDAFRLAFVP